MKGTIGVYFFLPALTYWQYTEGWILLLKSAIMLTWFIYRINTLEPVVEYSSSPSVFVLHTEGVFANTYVYIKILFVRLY